MLDMTKKRIRNRPPQPPALEVLPLVNASSDVANWLDHYWRKLKLPSAEAGRLAVTDDRQEFARWTGRRLNPLTLGCYCFLPNASTEPAELAASSEASTLTAPATSRTRLQLALPGFDDGLAESCDVTCDVADYTVPASDYRHLIFIEPDLLPLGIEVTVAHELIHLSDRVQGTPRKHRCHGYDSISVDEAALTGRDPELLRALLREETARRESALRQVRPYRYVYVCPHCGKEYARVRRYTRPVSCGRCDRQFNPAFLLQLRGATDGAVSDSGETAESAPTES
jgi:DNA-directed RNA polymerase subunit RPC12/RpoP